MNTTIRSSTATVGGKGRVTIPKAVREKLGLSEGDRVMFRLTSSGAEVVPMEMVPRDQVWFYSDLVQERIARSEEDIRLGRVTRTASPEEMQEHLDSLKGRSAGDE